MRIRDRLMLHLIYIKQFIIISSYFQIFILVHYISLLNRDFFFEFDQGSFLLYTHFIDTFINFVITKNNFD